jgi:hypothetical protein
MSKNYNNTQPTKEEEIYKRSGSVYSKIAKGNFIGFTCVNAWKSTQNGLITVSVMPYHKSDEVVDGEDNSWFKMIARVHYPSGIEKVIPCLMNSKTHTIVLKEISMCITKNGNGYTKSGKHATGYFGTFIQQTRK